MARIVFFGTPDYVLPVLEGLKRPGQEIAAVVTQPAKPVGRKAELTASPVALWAKANKIQVFAAPPQALVNPLKKIKPEVGVLAAYGRIVPKELIEVFPKGILNLHPSLLPRFRGASPVAAAIAAGDTEAGVTIIRLDEELDHGPIVAQFTEIIRDNDTTGTLRSRLFGKAAEALATILPAHLEGRIEAREQDHKKATFTSLLKKEYGFIPPKYIEAALEGKTVNEKRPIPFIKDCSLTPYPYILDSFIRAMNPWPWTWTEITVNPKTKNQLAKRLKILKAHLEKGRLILDQVQLEGKNPVTWRQFKEGYPDADLS